MKAACLQFIIHHSAFITSFPDSFGHAEFELEATDLDGRPARDGRSNEERADGMSPGVLVRVGLADGVAARSAVEAEMDRVVVHALVAEDVLAWRQLGVADAERGLRDEEV